MDPSDPSMIMMDDALKSVFVDAHRYRTQSNVSSSGASGSSSVSFKDKISFHDLPELIVHHLSPPPPIQIAYNLKYNITPL